MYRAPVRKRRKVQPPKIVPSCDLQSRTATRHDRGHAYELQTRNADVVAPTGPWNADAAPFDVVAVDETDGNIAISPSRFGPPKVAPPTPKATRLKSERERREKRARYYVVLRERTLTGRRSG